MRAIRGNMGHTCVLGNMGHTSVDSTVRVDKARDTHRKTSDLPPKQFGSVPDDIELELPQRNEMVEVSVDEGVDAARKPRGCPNRPDVIIFQVETGSRATWNDNL